MLKELTSDILIDAYTKLGYPLFVNGDYNLNIFGIRKNENVSNAFNDVVGLLYKIEGKWILKKYAATTDPGTYYRKNPLNVNGTAILKEGYYKGAFKIGLHHGSYTALVQNKPLELYRDNNKNNVLDKNVQTYWEMAGINIHRATGIKGNTSTEVSKWSAGCQTLASYDDFNEFMSIIQKAAKTYGSTFSYALFNEKQVF